MKVSIDWLSDYVDLSGLTPHAIAEMLTLSGTHVDAVVTPKLDGIVVGRVLEQRPHPGSNRPIWIHQVDTGEAAPRQVLAGAANAVPGSLVPVALPGTTVPSGTLVREGMAIAGERGEGMLCAADELGLGSDHSGIHLLSTGTPGQPLTEVIRLDAVLELDLNPNRPDLLGHLGVAREIAALSGRPLKVDFMPGFRAGGEPPSGDLLTVAVEAPDLCSRYIGAVIRDARVQPSPDWMQRRLEAVGQRPINVLVDISNYVAQEFGQPLHVFDLSTVEGGEVHVRRARAEETLKCLDGEVRQLDETMLVIADAQRPMAIAGIMGGLDSAVSEQTVNVVLESACFDGVSVRATSRALGLRTEASTRFEKGLAPELALAGARRAARLISDLADGVVLREWSDVHPRPQTPMVVRTRPESISDILGVAVPVEESEAILERLGFRVDVRTDGDWDVVAPVWRLDCRLEVDIAEEVGRIFGCDRIPPTLPGRRTAEITPMLYEDSVERIRDLVVAAGHDETVNSALASLRLFGDLGLPPPFPLANALSSEMDGMRSSLLPSLLAVARLNANRGRGAVRLFELSRVYLGPRPDGLADEPLHLSVLVTGVSDAAARDAFLRLRSLLDRVITEIGLEGLVASRSDAPLFHPGRTAEVALSGLRVGTLGELHPATVARFDLAGRAVALEVNITELLGLDRSRVYRSPARFPPATRDLAVVVADAVPAAAIVETIRQSGGKFLESVSAFDEYRGGQIAEGSRSLAFALTFRAGERTLTDPEVEAAMESVRAALSARHLGDSR